MEELLAATIILSGITYGNPWLFWLGIILLVLLIVFGAYLSRSLERARKRLHLKRTDINPILEPLGDHAWESEAVFNPAAIYDGDRVHLFYRALGPDGISRIGYASSKDGIHFDERLPHPVYEGHIAQPVSKFRNPFSPAHLSYNRVMNASGGGWGGSEDPRAVLIDNHVYLMYASFNGWDSIRMAISRLHSHFLTRKHWRWSAPVFLSPEGQVHKNWVIFPEKIGGKYAILHSISPKVEVEYRKTLMDIGTKEPHVRSAVGARRRGRDGFWDNWVRGAGPPPIKTKYGWLLFYHAMDEKDPNRYKLGAMVLDLDDPTKVLYRSTEPLLAPDMPYENEWKRGVVYACGAIVKDDTLFIYYGGGDRTVNVATTPLDSFMQELLSDRHVVLEGAA